MAFEGCGRRTGGREEGRGVVFRGLEESRRILDKGIEESRRRWKEKGEKLEKENKKRVIVVKV